MNSFITAADIAMNTMQHQQDDKKRITKLETKVSKLEKEIKELKLKLE